MTSAARSLILADLRNGFAAVLAKLPKEQNPQSRKSLVIQCREISTRMLWLIEHDASFADCVAGKPADLQDPPWLEAGL